MRSESHKFRQQATSLVLLIVVILAAGAAFCLFTFKARLKEHRCRYDSIIWETARRHGVSPLLVKAVIRRESNFKNLAVGAAGEVGLMQITEGAVLDWEEYSGQRCALRGLLFDPRLNIEIGTWYLAKGLKRWRNHRDADALALAHYNAGPSKAREWAPEDPRLPVSMKRISFPDTREYIISVREYWTSFEKEYATIEYN